ncbi:MAG: gluconate 2-dehydrogenase subunit 3 family protein [Cyclobacteriaceae bacterium]|nr:gluconate 2-dehydrogenase subunit 3 family protein [Cyclobacteriaceae bacterium SS2]
MDRRESLKSMLITSIAGGIGLQACAPEEAEKVQQLTTKVGTYGRTDAEKALDQKLMAVDFFNEHELNTIAVLCDIILPDFDGKGAASDAAVADFIEFIVKDMPRYQTPIRGGIMWLDSASNKAHGKVFVECSQDQQISIVDRIAYPGKTAAADRQGETFFSLMRNLTLTGYYTTQIGIQDLGYKGNTPNIWDGVPDDVLKDHGMEYPKEWLPKFVDQSKRDVKAEWDADGNLIT